MGVSELIPGISSGTIAFIIGLYDKLFASIKTVDAKAFSLLFSFKFKKLKEHVAWKFLGTLFLGAGLALALFTRWIHWCLSEPFARSCLYALFLGLVLASFVFCIKQVKNWNKINVILLLVGIVLTAWFVTTGQEGPAVAAQAFTLDTAWLIQAFVAGAIAISAMLLPGISGSYLLHVFGLYPFLITALGALTEGKITLEPLAFLFSMGLGIAFGAILFSRLVSYMLKNYHGATISFFSGIMLGASPSLWPFWTWAKMGNKGGIQLLNPVSAYLPSLSSSLFITCFAFFIFGIVALIALEKWAEKNPVKMDV